MSIFKKPGIDRDGNRSEQRSDRSEGEQIKVCFKYSNLSQKVDLRIEMSNN